ncbi:hypothetical protein E8E14_000402 [Neopestalotiopsis sp. 37M]|nr:hypothetical protein E8E14_000402 [Neopestalotiopsis sp. 37M]
MLYTWKSFAALSVGIFSFQSAASPTRRSQNSTGVPYRFLPGDSRWPTDSEWAALNQTVGGNLIRGVPLAQDCYGSNANEEKCLIIQDEWAEINPFMDNPVNTIDLYTNNNSCNPFYGPLSADPSLQSVACTLGNLAEYAIKITDADSAIAGINFARDKNIRLTVKNTGHDYLGRSSGKGSLALWTHNLKETSFFQYNSSVYSGPAARLGAGVQVAEIYTAAAASGYRAVAGSCPSVGGAGGFTQGGGHGPLSSAYGLGADQTLEFDVVTADGKRVTASPAENPDLYYALSGGGPGNYGVVLSMTVKVHQDGPVAGSRLVWTHSDSGVFMEGVKAWIKHLPVLDMIPGLRTDVRVVQGAFSLAVATLPDGTEAQVVEALQPFYEALNGLGITPSVNSTTLHDSFNEHYEYYSAGDDITRNVTIGSQLVPRDFVQDDDNIDHLLSALQEILNVPNTLVVILGTNVSNANVGKTLETNAVSKMWRDSLFLINIGHLGDTLAGWEELSAELATMNQWEQTLHDVVPGGGAYQNEGTYNNPNWREDYYGDTYDKLLGVKNTYDPNMVFWNRPAVGSDAWALDEEGRLHKV